MSDNIVYPHATVVTHHDGQKIRVTVDEPWSADDPFVKARPDLFNIEPKRTRSTVEQATASPGEKRRTKRAAAKSDG